MPVTGCQTLLAAFGEGWKYPPEEFTEAREIIAALANQLESVHIESTATPADRSSKPLDNVSRLLATGRECIDAALRIMSELATPIDGPVSVPDRGPTGVEMRSRDTVRIV